MRIRPISIPVAALALAMAAPAAAQESGAILFVVQHLEVEEPEDVMLEPISLVHQEGYDDPMGMHEEEAGAFDAKWFPAGRRYPVLSRGQSAGTVTIVRPEEPACGGLGAVGRLAPGRAGNWRGLAGQGLPEQRGAPWLREATAQERRTLDRMAAALFAAHGIDVAARPEGDTSVATVLFHRNARPVLVGTYTLSSDDEVMREASAFIIAEEGQDGYRPAFVSFHEGRIPDRQSRDLLDAADLDGDSFPELVLQNLYWESWDFSILTRDEHGWVEAYNGGGAGC